MAQGMADARLTSQIRRIILLAFPMEERDSEDRGRQMARYLRPQHYKERILIAVLRGLEQRKTKLK